MWRISTAASTTAASAEKRTRALIAPTQIFKSTCRADDAVRDLGVIFADLATISEKNDAGAIVVVCARLEHAVGLRGLSR